MAYLLTMVLMMGPALLINEEVGFAPSVLWSFACMMILLGSSKRVWTRQ